MKKHSIFLLLACLPLFSSAQYKLAKGDKQFNAGVGFSNWGIPIYVGLDYGVHQDISVGGEVSFRSYTERWKHDRYHHTIFGISANGNYHLNTILTIPEEFDFYAGINIGFFAWSYPDNYYGHRISGLGIGGQIGGRYYFKDDVGINLEFGGGNVFNGGKIGISLKF